MQEWKPTNSYVLERTQWYVKDWFTTTVVRNRKWWKEVGYPAYTKFWAEVDTLRTSGYTNRKPLFIDSDSGSDTVAP
jgi:hypothetical protein